MSDRGPLDRLLTEYAHNDDWVPVSLANEASAELRHLRARLEKLEKVREAAQALCKSWNWPTEGRGEVWGDDPEAVALRTALAALEAHDPKTEGEK